MSTDPIHSKILILEDFSTLLFCILVIPLALPSLPFDCFYPIHPWIWAATFIDTFFEPNVVCLKLTSSSPTLMALPAKVFSYHTNPRKDHIPTSGSLGRKKFGLGQRQWSGLCPQLLESNMCPTWQEDVCLARLLAIPDPRVEADHVKKDRPCDLGWQLASGHQLTWRLSSAVWASNQLIIYM